jgi:GTP pyrophosphokinase
VAVSAPSESLAGWLERQPEHSPLRPLLEAMRACAEETPVQALRTLEVLEQLRADAEVQAAALLHMHPPLQVAAKSALAKASGVRGLLEGLEAAEQVAILHARRDNSSGTEGLRRLLLALIRDLRVVLVLLGRQLVRLRDASNQPEAERRALASLTQDIHAPLANRLGIWQLKWELEDLSFRYLHPETYQRIARLLDEKRAGRERFVEEAKARLREVLAEQGIHADVDGRPKHIYSIWKKMQRKHLEFHELYDVRAIRVLVDDVAQCYAALGLVHQHWTPIPAEFDDYIAKPKGNDYRSLHTAVIGADGRPFEVQIRTRAMHEHAELGVAAHWRYKEGGPTGRKPAEASFERKVAWMRQLLEGREGEDEGELLAGFNTELLEDRKYLLTPRGEVIDLPHEGTVLDFAYHVHTEVGHRTRGAKVNGRIVPLDYRPNSGDQVEILTSKTGEPRRDWLLAANGFLASGRARDKVRSWFHKLDRERNVAAGREILEKELRRVAMMQADLAPVLEKFRLDSVEALHEALALGDVGPSQVSRALHEHAQAQQAAAAPPKPADKPARPAAPRSEKGNFTVEGVGNLLTQLARCCQPVPGDSITGYLTRGRGVSIHRGDCAALQRLLARQPERALPVNWAATGNSRYEVGVQIHAYDRKWLLKDLTNVLAQSEATIVAIQSSVDSARGLADVRVTLRVGDFGQLSQLLGRLDAVPGVQDARRLG